MTRGEQSTGDGAADRGFGAEERKAVVSKFRFSPREVDVAECFVAGRSKRETAEVLEISESRVRLCTKRMCAKLTKFEIAHKSDLVEKILLELSSDAQTRRSR